MLGVNSEEFPYIRGGKVKLQRFLSRTLFGTHLVIEVNSVQFFLHQVRNS